MFKTSDLEKILYYLKINDVKDFYITPGPSNYTGTLGNFPGNIKIQTSKFDLNLFAEIEALKIKNQVILIESKKL